MKIEVKSSAVTEKSKSDQKKGKGKGKAAKKAKRGRSISPVPSSKDTKQSIATEAKK